MLQRRTRPTFSEATSPLASSTCRCWTTPGSEIASGRASSLTLAGPWLRCSTIRRLVGSPSAWNIWSTGSRWLSIHLSMTYSPAMRALVQRVSRASVRVASAGEPVSTIGPGLLVLLGVSREDGPEQAERLGWEGGARGVSPDAAGNMSEPLGEREILCVSQFTLYGDT